MGIIIKNSFDLIRVIAALVVIFSHSFAVTGLSEPQIISGYSVGSLAVSVFFSLSGYLVFQSLERDPNFHHFLAKRGLRVFPGLLVMLFVTILICSISTTIPITDYFSRSKTWEYLGKIKLWGNDRLPGVFDNNAYAHTVNGSLWSLKWEWLMYCILAAIGFLPRRWWTPVIFISAFLSIAITKITTSPFIVNTVPLLQHISSSQNPFPLASFFLVGAFISIRKFRTHCKINSPFVWFISGITGILLAVHQPVIALSLLVPIIIVIVGESSFSATMGFEIKHDLSYGLYIYAFPIQQSIVAFWPHTSWWEIFLLATPITTVMAFLSWHYVEKPALQLKAHLRSLPYKKLI